MKKFLSLVIPKFDTLDTKSKILMFIIQIYYIWSSFSLIFINMLVYKTFQNLESLLIYNIILSISTILWIVWGNIIFPLLKIKIKSLLYYSYGSFLLWFLLLMMFSHYSYITYIFAWIYGFAYGLFRVGLGYYEIKDICHSQRDIYNNGKLILKNLFWILVSLSLAFCFFIFHDNISTAYNLFYGSIIFLYILSIPFIKQLSNDDLKSVHGNIIKNILKEKTFYNYSFTLNYGISSSIPIITSTIVAIFAIKMESSLWLYQVGITLFSILLLHFVWKKRQEKNRLQLMFFFGSIICSYYLFFLWQLNIYGLILFNICHILLSQNYIVGELYYGSIFNTNADDKNNHILEYQFVQLCIMFFSRVMILCLFFTLFHYTGWNFEDKLRIMVILSGFSYLLWPYFVFKYNKMQKSPS